MRLELPRGSRADLLLESLGVKPPPQKCNTFNYPTVCFRAAIRLACIVAHRSKCCEYVKKSVCLLHLQLLAGCVTLILSPCICPELDLIMHSLSLFCVFIATVLAVGSWLGKLLLGQVYRIWPTALRVADCCFILFHLCKYCNPMQSTTVNYNRVI